MEVIGDIFKNVFVYICTYVYLWLIHVEVRQKTKFCKAIILQLKNKQIFFLKRMFWGEWRWTVFSEFQEERGNGDSY